MPNLDSQVQERHENQKRTLIPVQVTFHDPNKVTIQSREFNLALHGERVRFTQLIVWGAHQEIQMTVTPL